MKKNNLKPILISIFLLGLFIGLGLRIIYLLIRGVSYLLAFIVRYWFISVPVIVILAILIRKIKRKYKKKEKANYQGKIVEVREYKIK